MAQSLLMKKGLEGLFNPENTFKTEAEFGKKIYHVAWAVEILAATIGLAIAFAIAYDAYIKIDAATTSDLINAIIGALPFLIIAVIEPTKIPLAEGVYKTRLPGWRLLILAALIGLTCVTFETMFNGLERTLSNTTRKITDSENAVLKLEDEKNKIELEIRKINEKIPSASTPELKAQVDEVIKNYQIEIDNINANSDREIAALESQKDSIQTQLNGIISDSDAATKENLRNIDVEIERLQQEIANNETRKIAELENYRQGSQIESNRRNNAYKEKRENIQSQIKIKRDEIASIRNEIDENSQSEQQEINASIANFNQKLDQVTRDIDALNFLQAEAKKKLEKERDTIKSQRDKNIRQIEEKYDDRVITLQQNLSDAEGELGILQDDLDRVVAGFGEAGPSNTDEEQIIKNRYDEISNGLRENLQNQRNRRAQIIAKTTGEESQKRLSLSAKISQLDEKITAANERRSIKLESAKEKFDEEKDQKQAMINSAVSNIEEARSNIPLLEEEINALSTQIDERKSVIREETHRNQVYRLAALWYKKQDVADVTREEVRNIAIVWFGSIAAITSTIGTILALISFILRDPEAFVERPKFSILRRVAVVVRQINRLFFSLLNLVMAVVRLILSFAEIFRGLVGVPVQRSLRRALLSYRKQKIRPNIVEKIVEVEVPVETVVEKTVEVEVPVEKIVEVEVPVEKVVIQEVPVEIVRKELVYVPLYSTESGLIDTSTQLKDAIPKLGGQHSDEVSATNKEAKSATKSTTPKRAATKRRAKK